MTKRRTGPLEKRGPKTKFKQSICQPAVELYLAGMTDFQVAQELKISERTLYRWFVEYPALRQAVQASKEVADHRVERSLYHRAVGYTRQAVKIFCHMGAPVVVPYDEHVPPDVGAITMWLTNRHGAKWKSKQSHEHGGLDGQPIDLSLKVEFVDAIRE